MKRLGNHTVVAALITVLAVGMCSCITYRSSYFVPSNERPVFIDRFRLTPRVFAFKESRVTSERVIKGAYSITIRVQDSTTDLEHYEWRLTEQQTDSLADRFLQQVSAVFVVDSLLLHEIPGEPRPMVLLPDTKSYAPRRENFLTLKFGEITLPREAMRLRAVLHVTRPGLPLTADSAVFQLGRIELEDRGLLMFDNQTQGY